MTLDELSQSQTEVGEKLKTIVTNYKKDSSSRKTLDYLQTRLKVIEELWTKFENTDTDIRTGFSKELDHPYFANDYYEAVRKGYEDIRSDIISRISIAPAKDPSASQTRENQTKESKVMGPTTKTTKQTSGVMNKQRSILNYLRRTLDNGINTQVCQSEEACRIKIQTIERYLNIAQDLHKIIWEQLDDISLAEYSVEEYFSLEEEAQGELIKLYEGLNQHNRIKKSVVTQEISHNPPSINLPKVDLPKFDGDYLKWKQFFELFTELVHNQPISRCQKMWYLKSSLIGDPEKLIRHLTTSDINYDAAWKIIQERYENTRLLTNTLLSGLLSQQAIVTPSASSIKKLHDTTQECLLGLQNLGLDITNWDPLVLFILIKKLDKTTHTLYEQALKQPRELQSLKEFLAFLEKRFQSLEALGIKGRPSEEYQKHPSTSRAFISSITTEDTCTLCKGKHWLFACHKFLQLTPHKRFDHVKGAKLCINCLRKGHSLNNCPSRSCTRCSKRHNTLLHIEALPNQKTIETRPQQHIQSSNTIGKPVNQNMSTTTNNQASLTTNARSAKKGYVLLSTAVVKLTGAQGNTVECRAILDSGSQLSFITERIAKRLNLTETEDFISIEGIGQRKQQTQKRVNLQLQSKISGFTARLEAHVLQKIISPQPSQLLDISSWLIPANVPLADPQFNQTSHIDLLIGAEFYHSLLAVGQIKLGDGLPIMQNTVLGWIIAGKIEHQPLINATCGICSEDEALEQQIERFWRLEEVVDSNRNLTTAEKYCETHFAQTTKRDVENRFVVSLPFKDNPNTLGGSRDVAFQRFIALERRLAKNTEVKEKYVQFMEEYAQLGHMEEIDESKIQGPYFFLPHHCVIKPESSTTKLRVVFDASAKTTSNRSLNDILHTGPTIQDDVFSILLRFRIPRYTFTADIEKMYRQINVEKTDRKYQLIWWRQDASQQVKCFQLNTVTYGTTCAPYLAIKCLQRLADDHAEDYPLGAKVLKNDFYVDDVLTGAETLSIASDTQQQLQALLRLGGFKLRKWCANHPRLMQDIPAEDKEIQLNFDNKIEEHIKTVGLTWLPKTDEFIIKTSWVEGRRITKRTVYSDIAHLFDPLGIMAPVVVVAKLFIQRLWTLKVDWDAALPQDLHTSWASFRQGLKILNDIKIPRHVYAHRTPKRSQVHIFADASERAYGAVAYVRASDKENIITVRLLCAKSRVAPIHSTTLPRLELCAAQLAAELAQRISSDLNIKSENIYLWSDSEITLAWINSTSSSFRTFVANRVSKIQELTVTAQWRHVPSKQNPADIVSRGLTPEKMKESTLWLYGPMFLHGTESIWPPPYKSNQTNYVLEHKRIALPVSFPQEQVNLLASINHGNSFQRLKHILAYVLRFINHSRRIKGSTAITTTLSLQELDEAHTVIVREMQKERFIEDLRSLRRFGEVKKTSSISNLTPFLDDQGLIRVGGRLEASNLSYEAKHPILLPSDHPITKLILKDIHQQNHHIGPQTLLAITRQKYWPLKGKTLTRSIVQHCVLCSRANPKMFSQLMGNLPEDRVQPARPFVKSGVDFCGPIYVHSKLRGRRPQKSYIAVFCCFATKATHLELVSDLTTEGFIGALRRFMGRRGHCQKLFCDNATNFVGAKRELHELQQILQLEEQDGRIATTCNKRGTEFHLIPPRAPHFGGLWEAAVKSAKHMLKRALASASLTYEELETLIIEIEAILNSRPITPISSSPNDLTALTPGHLLIGEPITNTTDTAAKPYQKGLLTRWKLISHIKGEFWRRWSTEYLNQLQQRHKWKQVCQNVKPDTFVIIKEENIPPLKWDLGRIVKTYAGPDNLVRVADVRTAKGIKKRAIHKLAPLPISNEVSSESVYQEQQSFEIPQHDSKHQRSLMKGHQESTTPEELPRKRQRKTIGSAIVTLLLTCFLCPIIQGSPVNIKPFKTEPGIYFESLGTVSLTASEWNLVAFYDMRPFWSEFEALKNTSVVLDTLCNQIEDKSSCTKISEHFQHLIAEFTSNNELLLPMVDANRTKRGAINFVGSIANSLFGVLEKMSITINNIKQNENHLAHLIRNQTSIIDATLNIIRRDQDTINKNFKDLETHINTITTRLNSIYQHLQQEKLSNLFISLAVHAMLTASNFHRIQMSILDVLTDTHHGKISPQLITPKQLRAELATIRGHLPPTLILPITRDSILQVYNLMTIQGRATQDYIIFRLNLPLCIAEEFELFNVIQDQ